MLDDTLKFLTQKTKLETTDTLKMYPLVPFQCYWKLNFYNLDQNILLMDSALAQVWFTSSKMQHVFSKAQW